MKASYVDELSVARAQRAQHKSRRLISWCLAVLFGGALGGCAVGVRTVPLDPAAGFVAHVDHRGIVVDEMPGASPAMLVPAGWKSWGGGPRFLLQAHAKTIAALWFPRPGRMIVRQTADPQSPLIGEVDGSWTDGAIRMTIKPANGEVYQSTPFERMDGRVSTVALSSQARTVLEVRGSYRADLRDAKGAPVGWLRAQISPYQDASRIYDGDLPPSVNGPLSAAAIAMLDADVSYIEDHAVDVYMGD